MFDIVLEDKWDFEEVLRRWGRRPARAEDKITEEKDGYDIVYGSIPKPQEGK